MFKLLGALFVLNIIFLLTDGIMDNGGGVQATQLNGAITETSTTITVDDTTYFTSGNKTITIGGEQIYYTSKDATHFYTALGYRGYNDTEAAAHADGTMVYTAGAAMVDSLMDYSITTTETGAGASGEASGSVVTSKPDLWTEVLPQMFFWKYGILEGDFFIIRYVLMGLCGILTAIIAMKMLPFVNFS